MKDGIIYGVWRREWQQETFLGDVSYGFARSLAGARRIAAEVRRRMHSDYVYRKLTKAQIKERFGKSKTVIEVWQTYRHGTDQKVFDPLVIRTHEVRP